MMKILICCLGGFSSSAMTKKVKNEIEEKELQDKISVEFGPFASSYKIMNNYDVVMVCPHIKYELPMFMKNYKNIDVPIYIFPPKMYGNMKAEDIYEDALDIIDGYKKRKMNPWNFPGEDNIMVVQRCCSYRKFIK